MFKPSNFNQSWVTKQVYEPNFMKKIIRIAIFFFSFFTSICFSIAQTLDSLFAKAEYGSKIKDVQLLMRIDSIDYYRVSFLPKHLKKQTYLMFYTKEYWKGKVVKSDTLFTTEMAKEYLSLKDVDSTKNLSLLTKPKGDSITFHYNLLGLEFKKNYKRKHNDQYSLRDGLVTNEKFKSIPVNKTLPLFVYSLPYEDPKRPGYLFYCELTALGIPPDKWWDKYKIEHYIVVEMNIVSR